MHFIIFTAELANSLLHIVTQRQSLLLQLEAVEQQLAVQQELAAQQHQQPGNGFVGRRAPKKLI